MKRFVFALDSVLQLRLREEQRQQRIVSEASARLREIQIHLDDLDRQLCAATADLRAHLSQSRSNARWLNHHSRHEKSLCARRQEIERQLHQARRAHDAALKDLAAASAQRKSLEKLRERHEQQWRAEHDKAERATEDELGARQVRDTHPAHT